MFRVGKSWYHNFLTEFDTAQRQEFCTVVGMWIKNIFLYLMEMEYRALPVSVQTIAKLMFMHFVRKKTTLIFFRGRNPSISSNCVNISKLLRQEQTYYYSVIQDFLVIYIHFIFKICILINFQYYL